jgi:hypothetical protein
VVGGELMQLMSELVQQLTIDVIWTNTSVVSILLTDQVLLSGLFSCHREKIQVSFEPCRWRLGMVSTVYMVVGGGW